ncbi:MAG: hypothetical protein LBS69_02290 [Prevotellaceae bacterium]|jgi:hypothetical protein|nr:hypothetical protein [Prevotellaceae bacterium]
MGNLFSKKTAIVRKMIEKRISTNPMSIGEISSSQVKYLSDNTVWNCPESMIFSIINSYLHRIRFGKDEKNAIIEIEIEEESGNYNNHLPTKLTDYIHYRLHEEYPIFAYLYTADLIYDFYDMISNQRVMNLKCHHQN